MNLLIVHEISYLSKITFEFQILPEILTLQGHRVTVIDYDDTWAEDDQASRVAFRTRVYENVHRAYDGASVTVRRPGMIRLPVLSRISAAATSGVEVFRFLQSTSVDAILLYGLPTVGIQVYLAARALSVPVFFRSIDVLNRLVPYRPLVPVTRWMERFIYRRVDGIVCVTPHLKQYVESFGAPEERVDVLPSGVDRRMFSPGPGNDELMSRWELDSSSRIMLFMGTVYGFSGLDRVIQDLPRLLTRHPRTRLLIVGDGEDVPRLQELGRRVGVSDAVVFTGRVSYDLLPDIIRSSELCINPFELNPVTRDILPTKLFQYLSCGKPLVATELPGTIPFLSGEKDGLVVADLEGFVDAVGDLMDDPNRMERLGKNGAAVTGEKYDWEKLAQKLVVWIAERSG